MTDSKLVPFDALANQALREEIATELDGSPITAESTIAAYQKLLGKAAAGAATLIPAGAVKAPKKVTDARSPETLSRASLALLKATGEGKDIQTAFSEAGLNREMLLQAIESPEWQSNVVGLCGKLIFSMRFPAIVSAMTTKAEVGDTKAAQLLVEWYGKGSNNYDEQTKALAEATPETRMRHTKALIEDLTQYVEEQERAGANQDLVAAARTKALAHLTERKPSR